MPCTRLARRLIPGLFALCPLLAWLGTAGFPAPAQAAPRAVVRGQAPPEGLTVLDRRGDLWLVTGEEAALAAVPGARILPEPPAARAAARAFVATPNPRVAEVVAQVQAADLLAQVEWIVGLGVRFSQAPNLPVVADSLQAKLGSYGLVTEKHLYPMGSLTVPNIIATQVGRAHPDSVFVICAHYDATSQSARYSTPGADDNATGVTAVLTAARLLAGRPVDYTVKYVLFAGEEQGMVGSGRWVADMAAAGLPIVGALNFDMVGWWATGAPFDLEIETNNASRWLADAICFAAAEYTTMPFELHIDDTAWWGDFHSFWQHGYAAVNHEESWDWYDPDFNPWYHTTNDTADRLSPAFLEGSVRLGVASLAVLAGVGGVSAAPAPSAPRPALTSGPNPFNGRVRLRLEAAGGDGPRSVGVYDLGGRRLAEVVIVLADGIGEATWDARASDGRALPGGVYVARAERLAGRPACRVTYVP